MSSGYLLNQFLQAELARLESSGLLRDSTDPIATSGALNLDLLVLCSNDYLGYAAEPWPFDAAPNIPSGSGASRLISGSHPAHVAAERELATWVGAECSLLFSSGFAANMGVISALARRGDRIISDALNHASIIDGCRLSGASIVVVPHCDTDAIANELQRTSLTAGRTWVVTESYFSMDGDVPDLRRLRSLCDDYGASLLVDEAHALGVFGPRGAGLCAEAGVLPDILIGTLGKAVGLQGAFVAGPAALRSFLWNKARSFVFSTGISPTLATVIHARVQRVAGDDGGRRRLATIAARLREELSAFFPSVRRELRGPIIPVVLGDVERALRISKAARDRGVLVQAIRPPTVPTNTARLRITATAALTEDDIGRAAQMLKEAAT